MVKLYANNLLSQCPSGKINLIMQLYYTSHGLIFSFFSSLCVFLFFHVGQQRERKSSTPVSHRHEENVVMMDKWFWRYFELRPSLSKEKNKEWERQKHSIMFRRVRRGRSPYLLLYLCFSCFSSFLKLIFLVSYVLPNVSSNNFSLPTNAFNEDKFM